MQCLLTAVLATLLTAPPPATSPTSRPAVMRTAFTVGFENATGQDQYQPAAFGLADMVVVLLAEQEHIAAVERQQLSVITGEQANSLKGLVGQAYAVQAGKLMHADTVIVGRLYLVDGKLTVMVQALDIATARAVAAEEMACRPEDLVESALQLARSLGKQMALPLPDIDLTQIDASPAASLHFAKALGHYYAGNMDAAIMQFMRTVDLDPDYCEAHYWAGMAYLRLGEDAHAVIEWQAFLKAEPEGPYSQPVRALLADARRRMKDRFVPSLAPHSQPATQAGP